MGSDIAGLAGKLASLRNVTAEEARRIVNGVYADGVVDHAEAEALFELNAKLAGADPDWEARFREAIKDFVLAGAGPDGWVTQQEADWLVSQIKQPGRALRDNEVDLLLDVLRDAQGAPESLSSAARSAIAALVKRDERVSKENVERLRKALYAAAGDGSTWVTRKEATTMFRINDMVAFARNDPAWNDLFARTVGNHLMAAAHPDPMTESEAFAREKWLNAESRGVGGFLSGMAGAFFSGNWFEQVTYDSRKAEAARNAAREAAERDAEKIDIGEENWLMRRLGWDEKISPAERALIEFLKAEAPGLADGLAAAA